MNFVKEAILDQKMQLLLRYDVKWRADNQ